LVCVAAGLALAGGSGCVSIHFLEDSRRPLVESVVDGETGPKILLLDIEGPINEAPARSSLGLRRGESTVSRIREQLDRAREDSAVRALLLRINSPGGTATASDIAYREILDFKRQRDLPVVAQLMGIATSGGYYVAMAADRVIAHPTTVTGSIGVRFASVNVVGLMQKLGVENQTVIAGEHKGAGSPLRRMTAEERAQIQSILGDMHERFKGIVAAGRDGLDAEQVDELADGRVYSAPQAKALGLVDGIGYLDDAVIECEQLAGLAASRVVTYHRPREWKQNLYTAPLVPERVKLELASPLPEIPRPGFLYLWAPGLR
jgi:protease-4